MATANLLILKDKLARFTIYGLSDFRYILIMAYETQNTIGKWLVRVINPDMEMQRKKLLEEANEFSDAIEAGDMEEAAKEIVDVAIVCFGIAFMLGVSLLKGINSKMVENRFNREWHVVDGVPRHKD